MTLTVYPSEVGQGPNSPLSLKRNHPPAYGVGRH